jgi:DNA-binding transcriptional regulator/RsmH inhibitor MraZ
MGMFYGEFELVLDGRGQICLPREVTSMIADAADRTLVLIRGRDGRPWLFSSIQFGKLVLANLARGRDSVVTPAYYLRWDRRRQLALSAGIISQFSLTRDLTLVGVRDHLELWNRSEWEVYMQHFLADAGETARRAARRSRRRK